MKTTIALAAFLLACGTLGSWGAVSLLVTKPPVAGGMGAGPLPQDPNALQGQWFQLQGVRTHEFHDNVIGFGGGVSSSNAIRGVVSNITYLVGPGSPIIGFKVDASITNDTVSWMGPWLPGSNQHGELQNATLPYEGTMFRTMLAIEFALTDLGNQPANWSLPYNQITPFIIANNEEDAAWYCYNANQDPLNPGNYFVPAWNFGDILPGQTITKQLDFSVAGGGLPPLDPRYAYIEQSMADGLDMLMNRTTSLKISTWLDGIHTDPGTPYPDLAEVWRNSNASVFHIPEAGSAALAALAGLAFWRRRR